MCNSVCRTLVETVLYNRTECSSRPPHTRCSGADLYASTGRPKKSDASKPHHVLGFFSKKNAYQSSKISWAMINPVNQKVFWFDLMSYFKLLLAGCCVRRPNDRFDASCSLWCTTNSTHPSRDSSGYANVWLVHLQQKAGQIVALLAPHIFDRHESVQIRQLCKSLFTIRYAIKLPAQQSNNHSAARNAIRLQMLLTADKEDLMAVKCSKENRQCSLHTKFSLSP